MEFRKRGTSVVSATSKFACCRMCMRLQDHCDGSVLSSRLLPARRRKKETQSRQKLPLLPTSPEGAHKRPPMQGVLAGRQDKAAGPTRSWSMPSTRGFPACAHPRATPQTGRSGLQAASRDDALPLTRSELACACLPFLPDHVSLPREQAGGGWGLCDYVVVAVSGADVGLCSPSGSR